MPCTAAGTNVSEELIPLMGYNRPEDGGRKHLRNASQVLPDYKTQYRGRRPSLYSESEEHMTSQDIVVSTMATFLGQRSCERDLLRVMGSTHFTAGSNTQLLECSYNKNP